MKISKLTYVVVAIALAWFAVDKAAPYLTEKAQQVMDKIPKPLVKTVLIEVERYPDQMSVGFRNPTTGLEAAASCDVAANKPEFYTTIVTEKGVMQTYGCNHLDLKSL